ncbi:MAG: NAD(P)-dependent alcohol dehydrogenase [Deltaproteobacteria bacterium]|nr:NAD(P)-dependent alcohol dehydrogenase [Deltaproteobacteria bacterium]
MTTTKAFGVTSATSKVGPLTIERRAPRADDVTIDILFCGVCHSDLHQARNEWGNSVYPMVPGHEIVGRVSAVGSAVKQHKVGALVGVGCMVSSCGECEWCQKGQEQFCVKHPAFTYNGTEMDRKTPTQGGYSTQVIVNQKFVLSVPESLDPAGAAPLLCAGITTWSPLREWNVKKGDKVAVVGLGGLGHMGVKLAVSLGADVTLISTSKKKADDAKRLGAQHFAVSTEPEMFTRLAGSFDFILDTVSATHDFNAYMSLLRPHGALVLVGAPPAGPPVQAFSLIGGNKRLAGSSIGGTVETQEMLDYCGKHGIVSDIEVIPAQQLNEAYERMLKSDVRYRFVVDVGSIK